MDESYRYIKLFEKQDTYRVPCLGFGVYPPNKYQKRKMAKPNCIHRKTMLKIDNPECFFFIPINSKIKQPMATKVPSILALRFPPINVRTILTM